MPLRYSRNKQAKYGNRKVKWQGETFDSEWELTRWRELKWLERKGIVSDVQRQVKFILIPTQRDDHGKLLYKECSYYADFVYLDEDGRQHVEDAKGVETEVFNIKRKLMYLEFGVMVEVVKKYGH